MNKQELQYVLKVLQRIKPLDQHIEKAVKFVEKDLANYEARRGQLLDQYEVDLPGYW